jgi:ABC-type phosphate transport system substrate-binding protein
MSTIAVLTFAFCATFMASWVAPGRSAADTTDPSTLVGEGGSFLTPVTDLLLNSDTGLAPLDPSYEDANIDSAISDFIGNGPGSFDADFVVSERPLKASEAAIAATDGRTFAYVPFAATPVAIATLAVCNASGLTTDATDTFCQDIPLTVPLVAALFTANLTSPSVEPNTDLFQGLSGWSDPRLTQASGQPIPDPSGIAQASTLEPSAENTALLSLIDSNSVAREQLDNAIANPSSNATTTSDAPSETWPFQGIHAFIGGDAGLIGHELSINAETNAPSEQDSWAGLGANGSGPDDVFPVSAVWTGSPQGTPWNVPTAAIQNAQGSFVGATEAAAAAAEQHVTLDPTTNLVTFNADTTDAAAYNNYLMVESYLVVPTTGLPTEKAQKLAQLIRFIVGPTAQSDEAVLGASPPTPAMVSADLQVASELDAESVAGTSSTAATTTTTTPSTTTTSTTSNASQSGSSGSSVSGSAGDSAQSSTASSGGSGDSDQGLAFTGASGVLPVTGAGAGLVLLGVIGRRKLRRTDVMQ